MRILGVAAGAAGVPVVVLASLAAFQWAAFWPALAGILICILAASAFALVWTRDLDLLTDQVRRVDSDDPGAVTATPAIEAEPAVMDIREIALISVRHVDPSGTFAGHRSRRSSQSAATPKASSLGDEYHMYRRFPSRNR